MCVLNFLFSFVFDTAGVAVFTTEWSRPDEWYCDRLLLQSEANKAESKKNLMRNTQGVHAAMRLNMEQTILSQYRRLPGFHSEFLGLEIMNESMSVIGVEDILNGALPAPPPWKAQKALV